MVEEAIVNATGNVIQRLIGPAQSNTARDEQPNAAWEIQ